MGTDEALAPRVRKSEPRRPAEAVAERGPSRIGERGSRCAGRRRENGEPDRYRLRSSAAARRARTPRADARLHHRRAQATDAAPVLTQPSAGRACVATQSTELRKSFDGLGMLRVLSTPTNPIDPRKTIGIAPDGVLLHVGGGTSSPGIGLAPHCGASLLGVAHRESVIADAQTFRIDSQASEVVASSGCRRTTRRANKESWHEIQ